MSLSDDAERTATLMDVGAFMAFYGRVSALSCYFAGIRETFVIKNALFFFKHWTSGNNQRVLHAINLRRFLKDVGPR